jgi:phosphomannomutase / phosphoglucomutase
MNRLCFREYDVRGVADRDLPDPVVKAVGKAFSSIVSARAGNRRPLRIAVGRDCRVSGPRIQAALVDGLRAHGANVTEVGVGPTPMLYFAVNHLRLDGGIMVTGSHNPGDENGLKMMIGTGSFYGRDINELFHMAKAGVDALFPRGTTQDVSVEEDYLKEISGKLKLGPHPCSVVLDAGNGSGGPLGLEALKRAGFKAHALYCTMDGTFPNHHPDPTVPKNLEALIAKVRETKSRVGLAYDGDADRIGVVDADGTIIWGDKLLTLFARALLKVRRNAVVIGEVKCSQTLYDDVAKHGGRPVMWKTGHSLIKTKMKEMNCELAGEMSGHMFFGDRYYGYDDALYAGLRLLEIMTHDPRSLSEMLSDLPKTYSTPEIRVACGDTVKFDVVKRVLERFKARGVQVSEVDGARFSFGEKAELAWGLVRASNTGPLLVLRFEAHSEARLAEIRQDVEAVVHEERMTLERAEQPA